MAANNVLTGLTFLAAGICAGVMGFAIQRGATCTVAAVDELLGKRRFQRLQSMLEASLWVVGGLAIAQVSGRLPAMPAGYALGWATVAGGTLLGVGAFVNGACVFGAIARLGSGEWAFLATPLGFYAGCVSFPYLYAAPPPQALGYGSPVLQAPWPAVILVGAFLLLRLAAAVRAAMGRAASPAPALNLRAVAARLWSPHAATTVIALAFLVMFMSAGPWAYTDVLADLARGMSRNLLARVLLLVALFAGAVLGGWTTGRLRHVGIAPRQLATCFLGGVLMGWGSLLIPGGNDGLVLVGMPLLWPYAWAAFLTMCVAIAAAQWLVRSPPVEGTLDVGSGRERRPRGRGAPNSGT